MSEYYAPLKDMIFVIRELTGLDRMLQMPAFESITGDVVDPYKQYSEPWFGCRKALRGGCWMTRTRMLRPTWRNYFTPDRRDVFAGFRTCAIEP